MTGVMLNEDKSAVEISDQMMSTGIVRKYLGEGIVVQGQILENALRCRAISALWKTSFGKRIESTD